MSSTASPTGGKRAERVARAIEDRIIALGWPVGRLIGSEQSLMAEHDASRGVLREAVRLLEHHGTARMRRGPGGGLVVQAPSPHAVRRATSLLLQYQQAEPSGVLTARAVLELDCLDLVADRIRDPQVSGHLLKTLEAETDPVPGATVSFHRELAHVSGSPAIALFAQTMLEIHGEAVHLHGRPSDPEPALLDRETSHSAHREIYEALVAGDLTLAREALSSHLEEVADATLMVARRHSEAAEDLPA